MRLALFGSTSPMRGRFLQGGISNISDTPLRIYSKYGHHKVVQQKHSLSQHFYTNNYAHQETKLPIKSVGTNRSHDYEETFELGNLKSVDAVPLKLSLGKALDALLAQQNSDGHWRYDLECHTFTPAYFIVCVNYVGETLSPELTHKIGNYLRRNQLASGGWSLVPNGEIQVSVSIITYFALKLIGDEPNEEHMERGRRAILQHGGVEAADAFARDQLALFGIIPRKCIPSIPVEVILLPKWFPFNIYNISFWARTTLVPMAVLQALAIPAKNPLGVTLDELFCGKPSEMKPIFRKAHQDPGWFLFFSLIDKLIKILHFPKRIRNKAITKAIEFVKKRLNGSNGFGSISPVINSTFMMFSALGYQPDHPDRISARRALEKLFVTGTNEAYTTACLSPVWDTANAMNSLLETRDKRAYAAIEKALTWLRPLQILNTKGDWAIQQPKLRPGGWAFFYQNPHYPDEDDTAIVLSVLQRYSGLTGSNVDTVQISRGIEWLIGMECKGGGWASYDKDNTKTYLKNVPFADHAALLDPPTIDVTSRVLMALFEHGHLPTTSEPARRGLQFILDNQEADGSWYGRWGVNYIYGTWSALSTLTAVGLKPNHPSIIRAVSWLLSIQNEDGGWGEDVKSYNSDYKRHKKAESTASQTSWALLGLMSAGAVDHPAVTSGISYLIRFQNDKGQWDENIYTGTGHPNFMYILYHGYCKYFPLQALAMYSRLKNNYI